LGLKINHLATLAPSRSKCGTLAQVRLRAGEIVRKIGSAEFRNVRIQIP
jgi:hypothetical protein